MKHNYCHLPVHEWCCSIVNKRNLYLLNRNGLILHTKSPPPPHPPQKKENNRKNKTLILESWYLKQQLICQITTKTEKFKKSVLPECAVICKSLSNYEIVQKIFCNKNYLTSCKKNEKIWWVVTEKNAFQTETDKP